MTSEPLANVLIVEDEMLVAFEVEALLIDLGYHVVGIAPDMPTAIALTDRRIDLALIDLNLRDGLTGPEIGRRLSMDCNASVLFVTANPRVLGEGIAGTIGVLTKPTDEYALRCAVEYALGVRKGDTRAVPPPALRLFGQTG